MTTNVKILSGLALTAAMLATISSDALARSGGGGTRSFSASRASTVVSSKPRTTTVSTSTARKQTISPVSQVKLKNKEEHKLKKVRVTYPCLVAPCPTTGGKEK